MRTLRSVGKCCTYPTHLGASLDSLISWLEHDSNGGACGWMPEVRERYIRPTEPEPFRMFHLLPWHWKFQRARVLNLPSHRLCGTKQLIAATALLLLWDSRHDSTTQVLS